MSLEYRVGDVFDRLAEIPDGTIDLIVTSPPFLALRSYLPADHPDKHREIGSEATPADFLDTLLALTAEWGRVLAPHGSICVELGDTYSGSTASGGDNRGNERYPNGRSQVNGSRPTMVGWPLAKSLTGIPTLYPWSLAYGRNLLTGQPSPAGQWRIRNVIVWARPNPPVGCVDADTEALTLDGWKRHDELRDGDLIAAYDPATDSCRFLPARFVRWQRDGEPMVAVEKRSTSQRLTEDHRAWVRTRKAPPHVRLARDITNDCQTLLCAPFDDVPWTTSVTVERAELLGWYVAEGTPHSRQARIVQSVSANPHKVERIRSLLERDGADFRETVYGRGASRVVTFHVKGELAEWLNLHHKRLPMLYVTTWPEQQARALFDGLIDGDGHRRTGRGVLFHQKAEPIADAVQALALRLGYRASKTFQPSLNLWQITMSMAEHVDRRWTKVRQWEGEGIPRETYTGIVWCPQIETTFWLARRNGRTFITGNSLGDKFRPATSYITVACRGPKRYFDLDAVRTEFTEATIKSEGYGRSTEAAMLGFSGRAGDNRMTHAGAPPLDWHADHHPEDGDWLWKLSTQPYSGWTPTVRRVPCGPDDGGERTASPDCPRHGDLPGQVPKALRDARAGSKSNRTPRTDDHPELTLDLAAVSNGENRDRAGSSHAPTTETTDPECSPAATPRSTPSRRTGPAPATTQPGTPSVETADGTARTSASLALSAPDRDTDESSTSPVDSDASREPQTVADTADIPRSERPCTCSFYKTITEHTSHYATFPMALPKRLIEAMCPLRVCTVCGRPSERIMDVARAGAQENTDGRNGRKVAEIERVATTLGWSDCGCTAECPKCFGYGGGHRAQVTGWDWNDCPDCNGTGFIDHWRTGVVLDPFAGSGTTLEAAQAVGRHAIGIDLDARNADLARSRVGMFLELDGEAV